MEDVCAEKGSAQPLLARALQQVASKAVDVPAIAARIVDARKNFMVIEINLADEGGQVSS